MQRPRNTLIAAVLAVSALCPVQALAISFDIPITDGFRDSTRISRGQAIQRVVDYFELPTREKEFLGLCHDQIEECVFVFAARSDFDDISFEPLRLYPDVDTAHANYDAINTASMLGIIHGYMHDEGTPFKPQEPLTRVQALKVALGSLDLLKWKEKFEMEEELGTELAAHDWWYDRYLHFAIDNDIVTTEYYFEPDTYITVAEMDLLLKNTLAFKEKTDPDVTNTPQPEEIDEQAFAATSEELEADADGSGA